MPIYDDVDIENGYSYFSALHDLISCREALDAFFQIYRDVENIAITPFIAQNLIKKYLLPLINTELLRNFHSKKRPTWHDIYNYANFFIIEGESKSSNLLKDIGYLVEVIYKKSTVPPREFPNSIFQEIWLFSYVCRLKKIPFPTQYIIVNKKKINILIFVNTAGVNLLLGKKFVHIILFQKQINQQLFFENKTPVIKNATDSEVASLKN